MNEQAVVHLIDDDVAVLNALTRLLRGEGRAVRVFSTAASFLQAHDASEPGCVLLDVRLPDLSGLALQQVLLDEGCSRPIIFMTGYVDVAASVCAMKAGASDFLAKPCDDVEVLGAVYNALERDARIRRSAGRLKQIRGRLATLTPREHEVMLQVVDGRLNKQIASDLGIAEKTIKVHRSRAMEKMGARSLAELVRQTLEVKFGAERERRRDA